MNPFSSRKLRSPKRRTPRPRSALIAMNPNHHLCRHGKNWWIYCAINPTPHTKDKLRRSLCTESVKMARIRRDELIRRLRVEGMLGRTGDQAAGNETGPWAIQPAAAGLTWKQRADMHLAIVLSLTSSKEKLPVTVVGAGQEKWQLCC